MQNTEKAKDYSQIFPEFQRFIVSRGFVSEGKAPYFAWWVKKFEAFCANTTGGQADRINDFLLSLGSEEKIADWQIEQARHAVLMFLGHYLDAENVVFKNVPDPAGDKKESIIARVKELIRVKHYAYSTERVYLDWIEKFFNYITVTRHKNKQIEQGDITDFLR